MRQEFSAVAEQMQTSMQRQAVRLRELDHQMRATEHMFPNDFAQQQAPGQAQVPEVHCAPARGNKWLTSTTGSQGFEILRDCQTCDAPSSGSDNRASGTLLVCLLNTTQDMTVHKEELMQRLQRTLLAAGQQRDRMAQLRHVRTVVCALVTPCPGDNGVVRSLVSIAARDGCVSVRATCDLQLIRGGRSQLRQQLALLASPTPPGTSELGSESREHHQQLQQQQQRQAEQARRSSQLATPRASAAKARGTPAMETPSAQPVRGKTRPASARLSRTQPESKDPNSPRA